MTERAQAASPQVLSCGTAWPDDAVEVARVLDAWGVRGGIKVLPFSPDPQALFCTKKWFVLPAEMPAGVRKPGAAPAAAAGKTPPKLSQPRLLRVKNAKEQGDAVVATLEDIEDRNAAEALKGARIFVSRSAFPTPDDDEFYWIDLIGLNVVNREGVALGTVTDLLDTGPHCVLRCAFTGEDGKPDERLIPFVGAYIDKVSLADRQILVDWGLDY